MSVNDQIGLVCAALLLISPLIFKVSFWGNLVVHPGSIVLLAAWCWTLGVGLRSGKNEGLRTVWPMVATPLLLLGWLIGVQAVSLALNSLYRGSWPLGGWLLLLKQVLYLAPLPYAALLVYRTRHRVIQLLSYTIPLVALLTLTYSGFRFLQFLEGSYTNSIYDSVPWYFAMGTFGEVLTRDGLVVRSDTIGQGAYGMYLVLVMTFSLTLALFRGWSVSLPHWYPWAQAWIICPFASIGIMLTGSRTSLILMSLVFVMYGGLFLTTATKALSKGRKAAFILFIMLLVVTCLAARSYLPRATTSLDRIVETAQNRFHLGASPAPYGDVEDRSKAVVLNVDTRIWLWERTVQYLYEHPMALVVGVGPDRKWFLEEVLNLPYEGNLIHFHTAHNLFLDIVAKGGLGALAPTIILCVWVFRTAYTSIHTTRGGTLRALSGASALLFVFWPPFILANFFGEEMFTDNLQLHWMMLFGLLLGLLSISAHISKAPRVEQTIG